MNLRKRISMKFVIFILMVLSAACDPASAYAETKEKEAWIPVAIHISTTISDGSLELKEVIAAARAKGIKAVIFTDRDFMHWEYGLWPFRNLIKKEREMNSAFKYGFNNYLKAIELESDKNPDMVIIAGVESAPFYLWSGIPFSGKFKISDWHKHILVIGLEKAQDYADLPVVSNKAKLKRRYEVKDILRLWPFLVIAAGLVLLKRRECSYRDDSGKELCAFSRKSRICGVIVIMLGILLIFNENPFSPYEYDQYSNAGVRPYQILIDYVNKKGGMAFWAHPEAQYVHEEGGIEIDTYEHVEDLASTKDYTGFSIFYEGYKVVGTAGGLWDGILREYCNGKRKNPVWTIAGLAFDHGTIDDLKKLMDDARTYVLVADFSKQGVLDAIRRGRMIVSRGEPKDRLYIEDFVVKDSLTDKDATLGEEIQIKGKPVIEIKGSYSNAQAKGIAEVRLIKDGSILKIFRMSVPFDMLYEDDSFSGGKVFYRFEIKSGEQLIVSNPIFCY